MYTEIKVILAELYSDHYNKTTLSYSYLLRNTYNAAHGSIQCIRTCYTGMKALGQIILGNFVKILMVVKSYSR